MFFVTREKKPLSFGTICDMEVKSMTPISAQACHTIKNIHICLVSFKMQNNIYEFFPSRGSREAFKMMV